MAYEFFGIQKNEHKTSHLHSKTLTFPIVLGRDWEARMELGIESTSLLFTISTMNKRSCAVMRILCLAVRISKATIGTYIAKLMPACRRERQAARHSCTVSGRYVGMSHSGEWQTAFAGFKIAHFVPLSALSSLDREEILWDYAVGFLFKRQLQLPFAWLLQSSIDLFLVPR